MVTAQTLGLVAAWFVFGQARIVLASTLAEHRIRAPDPSNALAYNLAVAAQAKAASYDPPGRRLLLWYRAVNASYWALVAGIGVWAILQA